MLKIHRNKKFRKDLKRVAKRGYQRQRLDEVVLMLMCEETLPEKFQNHALTGNWAGHREYHLAPDWLLIYRIEGNTLELVRTGSHADLFV